MKNFLSILFVSFCLAASAGAESIWLVSPDSYRLNTNNNSIKNYSSFSNKFVIDIEQLSAYEYSISDFLGGYYEQGTNYGSDYAMHGTFTIDDYGKIINYTDFVNGWGDSADNISGNFNTTTQTLSLVVKYAGYLEFHVMASKVDLLTRNINVVEAGSLSSLISTDEQSIINNLTLIGNLNGTDLAFIDNIPFLSSLNLDGARIVAGGTPESKQDTLGYQLNNERLKELYLPSSLNAIGDGDYNEGNVIFQSQILERIEVSAQSSAFSSVDGILYDKAKTKLIAAPKGVSGWVIIPEGVTEITSLAFQYCTEMPDITLPKSLTTIKHQAFDECNALKSVNIPANVTKLGVRDLEGDLNDETLSNPFTFCHSLQRLTVSTDNPAFYSSDNVLFSKDGKTIVAYPEARNSSYNIPESVSIIASMAFAGCYSVENVTIPESVTTLGENTFWCAGLTSIVIPSSIHKINNWTFRGCSNLEYVNISEGVDTIEARAFEYCSALSSITLPGSVEVISNGAFANCSSLKEVYVQRTDPPVFTWDGYGYGDSIASFSTLDDDILYVPIGFKGTYSSAKGWSSFSTIIDNLYANPTKFTIDNLTYYINNDSTKTVTLDGYLEAPTGKLTIPSTVSIHGVNYTVNTIGSSAFWGCNGLTSVEIPNNISSIESYAFSDCSGLTSIDIPSSVISIQHGTFNSCRGLTSVIIPNSINSIESYAFSDCTSLTSIDISSSVTTIEDGLFYGCKSMKSVSVSTENTHYCDIEGVLYTINKDTLISYPNAKGLSYSIPSSAIVIGEDAFGSCDITSVTIPTSVNLIDGWAFEDCSGLTSVVIPNTVNKIGYGAFYYCTGLTSMIIPNSVKSIGGWAFEGCSGLISVEIPNSVTSIEDDTFYGCSGLTSVIIPNSVDTIRSSAFEYCSSMKSITIPSSVASIGLWTFAFCDSLKSITVDQGNTHYCDIEGVLYTVNKDTLIAYPNGKGSSYSIPNSVTIIGNAAFVGCSDLTSVVIPNSVNSIIEWAFEYCNKMKSITIPSSVTSIGGYIFYGCDSLISIISENSTPPSVAYWTFYGVNTSNATLYVPTGSKVAYSSAIGWSDFTNIVEMDVEAVKSSIEGKIPVTKTYYSVSGKETGSVQKGINIVKESYSDGSSRSYKIVVK